MADFEKVDLHLHLDGSLSPRVIMKLAKEQGIDLGEGPLRELISVNRDCTSLVEYLKRFDLPGRLLQTEDALALATRDLIERLKAQRLTYAEIRFAPQLHTLGGLTQEQSLLAVMRGVREAKAVGADLPIGVILCMLVTGEQGANQETAELAKAYHRKGADGLDLAGAEGAVPMEAFRDLFALAYQADVPLTVHAGECGSYDNIATAISFGARRIGHGCGAAASEDCMKLLEREHVVLEMCPTSNLQTKAVASIEEHPIRAFFDRGIRVTVNTDNMTVSNTTLGEEYELLKERLSFTDEEIAQMNQTARAAGFLGK